MQKMRLVPDLFFYFEKGLNEVKASGLRLSLHFASSQLGTQ